MRQLWFIALFNVVEDIRVQYDMRTVLTPAQMLCRQCGEEAFHGSMVATIFPSAHAADGAMGFQQSWRILATYCEP
jgi:hypothetical protein